MTYNVYTQREDGAWRLSDTCFLFGTAIAWAAEHEYAGRSVRITKGGKVHYETEEQNELYNP